MFTILSVQRLATFRKKKIDEMNIIYFFGITVIKQKFENHLL